mmetsp:Transcript_3056/g.5161  ORF Transcript_3056/g.5161 Transcript_3056/m.5161 type:complete len:132 (-) Transcript_3056:174-569(-)
MINCDFENYGCMGGYMVPAIDFLITEGVSTNDCMGYQNKKQQCEFQCDSKSKPYQKYYCKPGSMKIETEVNKMQKEIYKNGPMMTGLMVYEDFYNYKEGVYEYTTGNLISGHAIRIVGWGHDSEGHLYWVG